MLKLPSFDGKLITDNFEINKETAASDLEAFLGNLERMLVK